MSPGPRPARSNAMKVPSFERTLFISGPLFDLIAQRLFARRRFFTEIRRLEHLANFDLALLIGTVGRRSLRGPRDRFLFRLHLDHPESGDQFLGLGEGSVDNKGLFSRSEFDARTLRTRLKPLT